MSYCYYRQGRQVMYSMRPLTTVPPIPQLDVMYKMPNIHVERFLPIDEHECREGSLDTTMSDDSSTFNKEVTRIIGLIEKGKTTILPDYEELEARQDKVLDQLAGLKKQISELCQYLQQSSKLPKLNETNVGKIATEDVSSQEPVKINIIVHANPNYLPYSILALQKLWNDVDIQVTSYKHSSVPPATQLVVPFQATNPAARHTVHLSLIWNNIDELTVTSTINIPITGEANFLRYISRLIDTHNYEKIHRQPHLLDTVLDWCYQTYNHLKTGGTWSEVNWFSIADSFSKWSGKSSDKFNIADITLWSLLKQFSPEKKPKVFDQWYESCEKTFIDAKFTDK